MVNVNLTYPQLYAVKIALKMKVEELENMKPFNKRSEKDLTKLLEDTKSALETLKKV